MKKFIYFICLLISVSSYAQSKYTAAQVEKTSDPQVIANFIKYNPNHPKTSEFKRKLFASINSKKTPSEQAKVASLPLLLLIHQS